MKVNLSAADLDKEFKKALHRTYLPVNNYGTSSMVQVSVISLWAEDGRKDSIKISTTYVIIYFLIQYLEIGR